jgi:hypothetical protein
MGKMFLRVYQPLDVKEIKAHLLVYGDLSANCANCQAIDLKLDSLTCPSCKTDFKYIAFRNIRNHLPKLQKLHEQRPDVLLVDFEDFQRQIAAIKAQEFLR